MVVSSNLFLQFKSDSVVVPEVVAVVAELVMVDDDPFSGVVAVAAAPVAAAVPPVAGTQMARWPPTRQSHS
jgi:hypothetical protein